MDLRDVSTGATGATEVAPKFSDALTLSPPGGGRFCPPSQRPHLNFPCGYIPAEGMVTSVVAFSDEEKMYFAK